MGLVVNGPHFVIRVKKPSRLTGSANATHYFRFTTPARASKVQEPS